MFELSNTERIKIALRQILRWEYAALQDNNPLVAALHINYAVGNLDLLRQMYSDVEILNFTGSNPLEIWKRLTEAQDSIRQRIEVLP